MIDLDRDLLQKKILIHVCKDRTLSYRNRLQPIFNGAAIPIYSVNSVDEARELIRLVSKAQWVEHPDIPGDTWYKIDLGIGVIYLDDDLHQLKEVQKKLHKAYQVICKAKEEQSKLVR